MGAVCTVIVVTVQNMSLPQCSIAVGQQGVCSTKTKNGTVRGPIGNPPTCTPSK
jgi:hypothetical protein